MPRDIESIQAEKAKLIHTDQSGNRYTIPSGTFWGKKTYLGPTPEDIEQQRIDKLRQSIQPQVQADLMGGGWGNQPQMPVMNPMQMYGSYNQNQMMNPFSMYGGMMPNFNWGNYYGGFK